MSILDEVKSLIGFQRRAATHKVLRLTFDGALLLERDGSDPADILVPSEVAPVFAVDLPIRERGQRLSAAPFALEDQLSQPIEEYHFALGHEVTPQRHAVAVIAMETIREWISRFEADGVAFKRVIPDAAFLPAPDGAAQWSVFVDGGRILVRTASGEAFAVSPELFLVAYRGANQPALSQCGEEWPEYLPQPFVQRALDAERAAHTCLVDLCQQEFRAARPHRDSALKLVATIAGGALATHILLLGLDGAIIAHAAKARNKEIIRLATQYAPLRVLSEAPADILTSLLPTTSGGLPAESFLPLLAQSARAISKTEEQAHFQSLSYDSTESAMRLQVELSDLQALDAFQARLRAAGLRVEAAGASVKDGAAQASLIVRSARVPAP